MTRLFRVAALPIVASMALVASTAHALSISLDKFRATVEAPRAASAKPTAAPNASKPGTPMVCTTKQTTGKAGVFRKKTTKTTTVCTPVKTAPVVAPAAQVPPVESFASVEVPAVVTPPAAPPSSQAPAPASHSNSAPTPSRPRPPAPTPSGNAGGNSTNVGSNSYVSPVIGTPALFAPASSEPEPEPETPLLMSVEPVAEVPEPATLALLGLGLAGLGLARRSRK